MQMVPPLMRRCGSHILKHLGGSVFFLGDLTESFGNFHAPFFGPSFKALDVAIIVDSRVAISSKYVCSTWILSTDF